MSEKRTWDSTRRPDFREHDPNESVAAFMTRLDAWKAQGSWIPANGGSETPTTYPSGRRLLYCYQQRTGRHAYLDCDTDMILTDDEAFTIMGHR